MLNYQSVINKRKYSEYLMLLVIQHNPHSEDPEALFEQLKMETGISYIDVVEPDTAALADLQGIISPNMKKMG